MTKREAKYLRKKTTTKVIKLSDGTVKEITTKVVKFSDGTIFNVSYPSGFFKPFL